EYRASDFDAPPNEVVEPIYLRLPGRLSLIDMITRVLREAPLSVPWVDLEGDAALVVERSCRARRWFWRSSSISSTIKARIFASLGGWRSR
ncbi:MAG: bifunctional isocitrate dehydrogenase kinase/phosphatase, partial [Deltaproteobacteria bacterium]|nr:bifunctional isocitrate dehydrogenase kinase/phosphatase [Deltaproteobacteria bacterium]